MKQKIDVLIEQLNFLYEKLEEITDEFSTQQVEYLQTKIDAQRKLILEEEVNSTFQALEQE